MIKTYLSINELLEEEHQYLWALPDEEYPVFKKVKAKTNKYGEINIDTAMIYVPKAYNYSQISLIKYWDRFKVVSPAGEVLLEDWRPYMEKGRKIPWDAILKSWLTKPRVVNYSRYAEYLPGRIAEYIKVNNFDIRKQRMEWLISLLATHDMVEINNRFYDFLDFQPRALQESENHPYDIDWSKYDNLQKSIGMAGEA